MTKLRELFRDTKAVRIFPDDFVENKDGKETPILIPDLLDRAKGHFSNDRVAVLFRPRKEPYKVNFPVGYWTQVLGLGETPKEVTFEGELGVYCLPANTDNPDVGSLDTFWRSAENFTSKTVFPSRKSPEDPTITEYCVPIIKEGRDINSALTPDKDGIFPDLHPLADLNVLHPDEAKDFQPDKGMLWAVSQAAPLRRIEIANQGNLHVSLGANCASGGFMGNLHVDGYLMLGSQQQFCIRNCHVSEKAFGGAWSMVFTGSDSKMPLSEDGSFPWIGRKPKVVTEPSTKERVEKPYIFIKGGESDDDSVFLAIPNLKKESAGADHGALGEDEKVLIDNADKVKVFHPSDSFADVQESAKKGTHIILSPGIYNWGQTLEITHSNQVVLGLGLATLEAPPTGQPCIQVSASAEGVRLSGFSLEASISPGFIYEGSTLLKWGDSSRIGTGNPQNPGAMHDIYCFVGGRKVDRGVQVETMIKVYSSHVMGDNLWLWRADHVKLMDNELPNRPELSEYHVTTYGECRCDTGLEVFGNNVTFYGLAIEHTYKDMLIWHGSNGSVSFFQSEMPYDVSGETYSNETSGYRVSGLATGHQGKGIGVYSYFRDYENVDVNSAVVVEATDGSYENLFTVWLNGFPGINSVVNGEGEPTREQGKPIHVPSYSRGGFWNVIWSYVYPFLGSK